MEDPQNVVRDALSRSYSTLLLRKRLSADGLGYELSKNLSVALLSEFVPENLETSSGAQTALSLVNLPIDSQRFLLRTHPEETSEDIEGYVNLLTLSLPDDTEVTLYALNLETHAHGVTNFLSSDSPPNSEDEDLDALLKKSFAQTESIILEETPERNKKTEDVPDDNVFQKAFVSYGRELSKQTVKQNLEGRDYNTYNSWDLLKEKLTKHERDAVEWVLLNAGLTPKDFESLSSDYGMYFLKLIGALSKDWIIESEMYKPIGVFIDSPEGRIQKTYSISEWQLDFLGRLAQIISHSLATPNDYWNSLVEIYEMGSIYKLGTGTGKTMAILTLAMLFAYSPKTGRVASGQQGKVIIIQPKNLLTSEFGTSLHNLLNTRCGLLMVYDEQIETQTQAHSVKTQLYFTKLLKEDLDSLQNLYDDGKVVSDDLNTEEEDLETLLPKEVTQNAKNALSEAKTRLNVAAYSKTLTPLNHTFLVSTPEKALNLLGSSYLKLSDDRSNKSFGQMVRCVLIDEGHLIVDANRGFVLDEVAVYLRILQKPFFLFSGTINDIIINSLQNVFYLKTYSIPEDKIPKGVGRHPVTVYIQKNFNQFTQNKLVLNGITKIYGLDGATVWLPDKSIKSYGNTQKKNPGFYGMVIKHCLLRLLFGEDSPMKFFDSPELLAGSLKTGYKNLLNEFRALIFYQSKIGLEALYAYLVVFSYFISPDVQRVFENDSVFEGMPFNKFPFSLAIVPDDLEKIILKCEEYLEKEIFSTKTEKDNFDKNKNKFSQLISDDKSKRIVWLGFRIGFLFYHASMADNVITHDDNMLLLSKCINGDRNAVFPCNLIICTSVIQEGVNPAPLSLLMCDPWSYSRLILEEWRQIRGRLGRQKPGEVILLFGKNQNNLKYSNFNSDVVYKSFPSNLFYKRYFFAYQYLQNMVDEDFVNADDDDLKKTLQIFSVAGLFTPIDHVNPSDYDSPEDLLKAYEEAQVLILRNLPSDIVTFLQIIFQRRLRIPIVDAAFLMYTVKLCREVMSEEENIGPIIVACAICLTFLKDKVKALDYEESITQNKTLSNIISTNYTKMYSVDLPDEFRGEIVRFSKRLYSVITGHVNVFINNYQAVPFEFLEAIYPTLKMMNEISVMLKPFPSVSKISQDFMDTFQTLQHTLSTSVSHMNLITTQTKTVYSYIKNTPKTLPLNMEFNTEFTKNVWQVATDNQGERIEKFLLGLLNVSKTDYKTISKLMEKIKALLAS